MWLRANKQPRIMCLATCWHSGVSELGRRTLGRHRESGAFLLGERHDGACHVIHDFVFYDDIDSRSLDSGIVRFNGDRFPVLWEICRARGYGVVADIHVHPGGYGQSASDRADPVMPRVGHIAFILPNFAAGPNEPGHIGMYEFLGGGTWRDHSHEGGRFFQVAGEAT